MKSDTLKVVARDASIGYRAAQREKSGLRSGAAASGLRRAPSQPSATTARALISEVHLNPATFVTPTFQCPILTYLVTITAYWIESGTSDAISSWRERKALISRTIVATSIRRRQ